MKVLLIIILIGIFANIGFFFGYLFGYGAGFKVANRPLQPEFFSSKVDMYNVYMLKQCLLREKLDGGGESSVR